jgi:hypothetical protein
MIMRGAAFAAEMAVAMLFLAFLGAVVIGLLRNDIEARGILQSSLQGRLSLYRLQFFTVTLGFSAVYCLSALALGPGHAMPDVPTPLLGILIGSQATFLAGKRHHYRRLRQEAGR